MVCICFLKSYPLLLLFKNIFKKLRKKKKKKKLDELVHICNSQKNTFSFGRTSVYHHGCLILVLSPAPNPTRLVTLADWRKCVLAGA